MANGNNNGSAFGLTNIFDQVKGSLNWIRNPEPNQTIVNRTVTNARSKFFTGMPKKNFKDTLANMDRSYRQ